MRHTAKIKKRILFNTFMLHSKSTYFYKHKWFSYLIPSLATLSLLFLFGILINPVTPVSSNDVYALNDISTQTEGNIVPENGVALRIDTALNENNTKEEQVTGNGTKYIKVDFTVGANNIQNYDVYVQADSTALTGASHGEKLQSITSNATGTVGTKQWGYAVERGDVEPNTMTYKPIQTSVSTSADGQDAGSGNTLTGISQPYTLAFAANLDGMAADHYKSNITLSVAAGATDTVKTGLGFNGITEMQQMTSSICSSAANGLEGRLKDTRDQKVYWVAKFKNMCWMTQNLDLDLNTSKTLTSADSDVATNWTPQLNTYTIESTPNAISSWGNNNTAQKSFDPGNYYYTLGSTTNQCTSNNAGLSACTENGWKLNATNVNIPGLISIAGWTPTYDAYFITATSYVGTDGQSICNKTSGLLTGNDTYEQCRIYYYMYTNAYEHYHAGNYYSYPAIAAGTLSNVDGEISGSICPKGWKMPTGGSGSTTAGVELFTAFSGLTATQITARPYYFIRSGSINGSNMSSAGDTGRYWSSTTMSNGTATFVLHIPSTGNVAPTGNGQGVATGLPVRCVAR